MIVLVQISTPVKGKIVPLLKTFYKDRLTTLILELIKGKPNVGGLLHDTSQKETTHNPQFQSQRNKMNWNKPYCFAAQSTAARGHGIVLEHSGMERFASLLPHWHVSILDTQAPSSLQKPTPTDTCYHDFGCSHHALNLTCVTYPDTSSQQYNHLSCQ